MPCIPSQLVCMYVQMKRQNSEEKNDENLMSATMRKKKKNLQTVRMMIE